MHLIKTISTKTLGKTTAGELVKLSTPSGKHFAVVLADDPQGKLVGFLEPAGAADHPIFRRVDVNRKCLS